MANKRHKPEEIVTKLRQVDVLVGQGMARIDAIREVRIMEQTYYRPLSAFAVQLPAGQRDASSMAVSDTPHSDHVAVAHESQRTARSGEPLAVQVT
jgi:hypothetical protein